MTVVRIVSGNHKVVSQWLSEFSSAREVAVLDVDTDPIEDPSEVSGWLPGTDPRVFPCLVNNDPGVVDTVSRVCSVARRVVSDAAESDTDVVIAIHDGWEGDVVAPAVAAVVAGFLRSSGVCEAKVDNLGLLALAGLV